MDDFGWWFPTAWSPPCNREDSAGGLSKGLLPQPTARLKMQDVKGPVCQHDASYCKRVQVLPLRQLVRELGTSGTSPSGITNASPKPTSLSCPGRIICGIRNTWVGTTDPVGPPSGPISGLHVGILQSRSNPDGLRRRTSQATRWTAGSGTRAKSPAEPFCGCGRAVREDRIIGET